MNELRLEDRTNSEVGIKIIRKCLEQIKSYNDFVNRERIVIKLLKEEYPNLNPVDVIGIKEVIYRWTEQYEHPNKPAFKSPSSMVMNPFSFGISQNTGEEILKIIRENEKEYMASLGMLYSEYS